MHRILVPVLTMLLSASVAAPLAPKTAATPPPDSTAQRILDAYEAARPPDADLAVFRLDWAATLKEAKSRAARENRPIFFVSTMQLKEAGDLKGGHC